MDEFFENDGPDLNGMGFDEFLHWLYENRDMFDELDMDEDEDLPFSPSFEPEPTNYNYDRNKSIRQTVVADRYGPFICYRN